MYLLLPNNLLEPRQADPHFAAEAQAAKNAGFPILLYSFEQLRSTQSGARIIKTAAPAPGTPVLHRGWMLSDHEYLQLYTALVEAGYQPVTAPSAYNEAHYLPLAYSKLAGHTPESAWITGRDPEAAWALYQSFWDQDAILKDWVKSAKYRWREACFIPWHTTRYRFFEIFQNFLEDRSSLFEKGVVLRRYHPLRQEGVDMRGMPIVEEYRLYFVNKRLLFPVGDGDGPMQELDRWERIACTLESDFLSMDVARQRDGSWIVIEVGDGGVSGLPPSLDPQIFFDALARAFGRIHA